MARLLVSWNAQLRLDYQGQSQGYLKSVQLYNKQFKYKVANSLNRPVNASHHEYLKFRAATSIWIH